MLRGLVHKFMGGRGGGRPAAGGGMGGTATGGGGTSGGGTSQDAAIGRGVKGLLRRFTR